MTSNRLVTLLRELTANQYSDNVLLMWLSNCENTVLTDVLLASPEDCVELTELNDEKLLVPHPWDKLYLPYMQAQVAHANGEYDHYGNYIALFNAYLEEYARHILETVQPAGGEAVTHGYYLSAYAIAVEHGYVGTVEQWLESLIGPQGNGGKDAYTIAVENGFNGTVEQWLASMKGDAATVEIVGADALAPGAAPTVTEMAGSTAQYRLYKLGIPQGPKGDTGGTSLPIARANVPAGTDDAYTATGDLLPTVSVANNDEQIPAVGKGLQIVFIPMVANKTESPKLRLNDGEVIPIRMRWYTNKGTDESVPEATTNVEVGSLMRGVPYTLTFCGKYWLIDSFVHCPTFVVEMTKSSDGTITVDKTFAQIKSAYAAGQQIVCACYDESEQWDDRFLLPLESFYESGVAHFGRVIEVYQGIRELVTAYINSRSSGDVYGLDTWEIKNTPDIPSALPNPNAITFTGAVTGSYNGSKAMTVEIPIAVSDDHINELINTALNAIGVAEEGAY